MRLRNRRYALVAALAALCSFACGGDGGDGDTPNGPSGDTINGTWAGSAEFPPASAGGFTVRFSPLRVRLTQSGSSLTGTYEATNNVGGGTVTGNLTSGSVNGSNVRMTFDASAPGCPANWDGTRAGTRITGTVSFTCQGINRPPEVGTFELTKQ